MCNGLLVSTITNGFTTLSWHGRSMSPSHSFPPSRRSEERTKGIYVASTSTSALLISGSRQNLCAPTTNGKPVQWAQGGEMNGIWHCHEKQCYVEPLQWARVIENWRIIYSLGIWKSPLIAFCVRVACQNLKQNKLSKMKSFFKNFAIKFCISYANYTCTHLSCFSFT